MIALRDRDHNLLHVVRENPGEIEHRIGSILFGGAGRPDVKARMTLKRLERMGLVENRGSVFDRNRWYITPLGRERTWSSGKHSSRCKVCRQVRAIYKYGKCKPCWRKRVWGR